jgi:glycosyltransferase involved in cell wall biosynthesis
MPSPTVDIIVPVWNNPFETRACLAALLEHSSEARLIIIDNGSSRETQLMLEEFSEPLGERGLFITSDRNIGLVPAINKALASSDSDFAVIVRPNVTITNGWLNRLLEAGSMQRCGIVSPVFRGSGAPPVPRPAQGCALMETFAVSFSTLLIRGELLKHTGGFDEGLDGGDWCLRDFIRRAGVAGYHTGVTSRLELQCGPETVYGSIERRQELERSSRGTYRARWGVGRHYCLYFGPERDAAGLSETVDAMVAAARLGHRFTLLLHRRQFKEFRRRVWNGLHTSIEVNQLPVLGVQRSILHRIAALHAADPDLIPVRGEQHLDFPGAAVAICLDDIIHTGKSCDHPFRQWDDAREAT